MTAALLRIPTADELELARLQVELQNRQRELERLDTERDILETALTRFAAEVKVRIGDIKDEIRELRRELEMVRQQIERLRADPTAVPADVERAVAEEMAQSEAGFEGEFIDPGPNHGRQNGFSQAKHARETEVLRLYRELAKRHHPDLARTPAEKERRADLMLRINVAFRERDLATLQSIYLEVQLDSPLTPEELCRQRLSWTRHEISRIDREIRALVVRIDTLTGTDTYSLWQAEERGELALELLELRTRQRLIRERERLDDATATYDRLAVRRQVMQRRAASRSYDAAQSSGGRD